MANELLKPVEERVQDWATQHAAQYQVVAIPAERTDALEAAVPFEADASYFRLWLCEVSLGGSRAWFHEWYPLVQASVQLRFGAEPVRLDRVIQAPSQAQAGGVVLNYALTDPVPYRGGTVAIEAALLALPTSAQAGAANTTPEGLSARRVPPPSPALPIAGQVAGGLATLMQAAQGEVQLGFHQVFTEPGDAGANPLRPGYFAVILAAPEQVPAGQLSVRNDRLYRAASEPAPLSGYDHLLFRIESRATRPDWQLAHIEQPLDSAIKAYLDDEMAKGEQYTLAALEAIIDSPDLARQDRRRASQAIFAELESYRTGARGTTGQAIRSIGQIIAAHPMSIEMAAALPDITLREVLNTHGVRVAVGVDVIDGHARIDGIEMTPPPPRPQAFEAYPLLNAPVMAAPAAPFEVTVGFASELDPALTNAQHIAIAEPQPNAQLLITLDGDGVTVLGFVAEDGTFAPDKSYATLPLALDAQCKFRCQVQLGAGAATITVRYFYQYQQVGMATRAVRIEGGTPPAPTHGGDDQTEPEVIPDAEPADRCRMQMPPPPGSEVDLQVFISQLSGGGLQWRLAAPRPPTMESCAGKDFDEKDAREFAHQIIGEMNEAGGGVLGANAIEAMGQRIADMMPDAFFRVLRDVYQAVGRRAPTVLLMLEREAYVPWELAWLEKPLDPALPKFLGAQAIVGRWIQHDKIVLPPPVEVDLHKMTVVAGAYGGTSLPALKHAGEEQAALQQQFDAEACEATRAALDQLVGRPVAGHLLHFVVHGTSDPAMNDQALLLNKGQIRSTQLMGSYACGDDPRFAFIFMNACQVGTAGSSLGQAAGFPGDIIRGGAAGFIGPLWSVRDDLASLLAGKFYQAALDAPGRTLGEIMRALRTSYQPGDDNTPLAYLYYGHPNMRLHRRWPKGTQP